MKSYDVIILGSGFSGNLLATVLSRQGLRVVVVDRGTHPRFAIGESTVPETTTNLKIISRLFDVPEVSRLASFFEHRDQIGSGHGIKKGFSFCYHEPYEYHHPEECTQTGTLTPPLGPDSHWFRQDTDQAMMAVATSYGTDFLHATDVERLEVGPDEVYARTSAGEIRAKFVVDAAGSRSPFAKQMGIREESTHLETRSRGFFTHMVGVRRWDSIVSRQLHRMPYSMDQTTLHHLFDGGWVWIIPFDNHDHATNQLCSVGVVYDLSKHPKSDLSPQQEFDALLERYPSIARQVGAARPVRDWVSSSRLQYSSSGAFVGGRYFALPHAVGFVDPLFSSGLVLTTHAVAVLADILIRSFSCGRLDHERLRDLERAILGKIDAYDALIATSFRSFRSFDLWNAWYRVWEIGTYFNTLGGIRCLVKHEESGDLQYLRERFEGTYGVPLAHAVRGYTELMHAAAQAVAGADDGEVDEKTAVDRIYAALDEFDAMPPFIARRDPRKRTIGTFTIGRLVRMLFWGRFRGPARTKHYYDFGAVGFVRMILRSWWSYFRRHRGLLFHPLRLMLSPTGTEARPKDQFVMRGAVRVIHGVRPDKSSGRVRAAS